MADQLPSATSNEISLGRELARLNPGNAGENSLTLAPSHSDTDAIDSADIDADSLHSEKGTHGEPGSLGLCYYVRYEGNNNKKWDGREILIDKSYLESCMTQNSNLP